MTLIITPQNNEHHASWRFPLWVPTDHPPTHPHPKRHTSVQWYRSCVGRQPQQATMQIWRFALAFLTFLAATDAASCTGASTKKMTVQAKTFSTFCFAILFCEP